MQGWFNKTIEATLHLRRTWFSGDIHDIHRFDSNLCQSILKCCLCSAKSSNFTPHVEQDLASGINWCLSVSVDSLRSADVDIVSETYLATYENDVISHGFPDFFKVRNSNTNEQRFHKMEYLSSSLSSAALSPLIPNTKGAGRMPPSPPNSTLARSVSYCGWDVQCESTKKRHREAKPLD